MDEHVKAPAPTDKVAAQEQQLLEAVRECNVTLCVCAYVLSSRRKINRQCRLCLWTLSFAFSIYSLPNPLGRRTCWSAAGIWLHRAWTTCFRIVLLSVYSASILTGTQVQPATSCYNADGFSAVAGQIQAKFDKVHVGAVKIFTLVYAFCLIFPVYSAFTILCDDLIQLFVSPVDLEHEAVTGKNRTSLRTCKHSFMTRFRYVF